MMSTYVQKVLSIIAYSCICLCGIYNDLLIAKNIKPSRQSSYPYSAGDTFRAIADHIVDETRQLFRPEQVQKGDIIFLKTDFVPTFFKDLHPRIAAPYILITHNAVLSPIYLTSVDHPWKGYDFSPYLEDPKVIVWFAQNIDIKHPKLQPLPLGIANGYWKHGNVAMFKRAQASPIALKDKKPRLYINYMANTNASERKAAYEHCKKLACSDVIARKSPDLYLEDIKQYRFILSPPGNGVDCHRAWEALLMGSIPIMKHSLLDPLFDELPVIFVDTWSDITVEFLENEYQRIQKSSYKLERMYADYWIHKIKSYQ